MRAGLDRLAVEHSIAPVELVESDISVDAEEAQVDVSGDPMRNMFARRGPVYIAGQRIRYIVPFRGDPMIFRCRTSSFDLNPPRAQIEGREVVFEFLVPLETVPQTKVRFEEQLKSVKQYLEWGKADVVGHNAQIRSMIGAAWKQRQEQLRAGKQNIESLGYPVRRRDEVTAVPQSQPAPSVKKQATNRHTDEQSLAYDVALSFAGENRDYVEQVAQCLKEAGVNVFYDKFETAQLWGQDLADHLGEVYGKKSRFVVMFISKYYPSKGWPTHERQSAQARAIRENKVVLLPARFDDTEIAGLPSSTGYVDLLTTTPDQLAELIRSKLAG